jgi:alpha-D-xyloside xylohydrolase
MKKNLVFVLCFLSGGLLAQNSGKGIQEVKTNINSMDVEVQFFSPSIVRVVKSPEGKRYKKESLSVVKTPEKVDLTVVEQENIVSMSSSELKVDLNLTTGKIVFLDVNGNQLFAEKDYGTQFTDFNDAGVPSYRVRQAFMLEEDEVIYGLGQQQTGRMNQRNQMLFLRNRNMHICIPIIHSVKGYAVFWDNYSPTTFTDNPWETSFDSEVGDCSDYYFMYGGNADGVIADLRDLTGQAPMYPLWTLGFWQCRERYKSQEEIVNVVKRYRDLNVPLDGIVQDWQYWGPDSNWNSMNFDNPEFPDPKKMIDDIHQMNVHIMISVWASFGPDTKQYKIMKDKKMLMDFKTWPPKAGAMPYDPYHPEARNIYWSYMKNIFDLGMDAWWLDSTEPDHLEIKDNDFNEQTYLGSFRRVHNAFPLMSNKGVYEHQRAVTSDKRVFLLTRSSFAGQQRFASHSWSGDVVTRWDIFRNQIPAGLNYSLCGIPYWNTDIGGFFAWEYGNNVNNKGYHEIHTRWHEFATFTPIMRSHNSTPVAVEIYQFGKKGDWAYDAIEKYIRLRYRLLPYIYSTSWEVTNNAGSFMRHLSMDFNHDKNVHTMDNQYMFGRNFLIKAVTEPMYVSGGYENKYQSAVEDFSKVKSVDVYLPSGTNWIDFWTGETFNGGRNIKKETPIDIIPVYLKAGTILPWGPDVQYSTEKKWDNLEIRIYPGANGKFTFYEDENDNYNYEKGAYSTIDMEWDDQEKTLTIGDRKGAFPGMLKNRKFKIVMVAPGKATGSTETTAFDKVVSYNGKKVIVKC